MHFSSTTVLAGAACAALSAASAWCAPAPQLAPWPAEAEQDATNLSDLTKGFRKDLSGAVWNPLTRTLWVCRNGPGSDSRLWVLEEDAAGELRIGSDGERRGEWRELGDCEGVTFADFGEEVVYLIVEGEEVIHEVDVSTYGDHVLARAYDTSPFLPLDGSDGAEGITFVPDAHLARAGFVDQGGVPRTSRQGMGGLMLVGHQNGGGIFAFDLNRQTAEVEFVGQYRVTEPGGSGALSKVVALEFDRSTGRLFIWHGLRDHNVLSVVDLSSEPVATEPYRRFSAPRQFHGPSDRSYEGLALMPAGDCGLGGRGVFLTVDDGKAHSLYRYGHFRLGCQGIPAIGSR